MAEKKPSKAEREAAECVAAIEAMGTADRPIARKLHAVITAAAPELAPKLWYKQPAYAKDGTNIVFFRGAEVDGERYLSLGFTSAAAIDEGTVWPTSYAVTKVTEEDEAMITALVRKAVG